LRHGRDEQRRRDRQRADADDKPYARGHVVMLVFPNIDFIRITRV
jgi:hypothetical protein